MNHKLINQLAGIKPKESLEADGSITVYSLESGRVVAQYEGLEVHEAMQELAALRERVGELEWQLAAIKKRNRRLAQEVMNATAEGGE